MSNYVTKRSEDLQKPIEDAKEPLMLEVKPLDIVRASDKNSKCCAFVRACEREVKGAQAAFFFRSTAYVEYEDKILRYILPPSVQKEIVMFDRSRTMEPGVYQLSAVHPARTMRALKKMNAKRKTGNATVRGLGAKRTLVHRTQGIRTLDEPTYRSRP